MRELRNTIERLVVFSRGSLIEAVDLPQTIAGDTVAGGPAVRRPADARRTRAPLSACYVLDAADGNRTRAAEDSRHRPPHPLPHGGTLRHRAQGIALASEARGPATSGDAEAVVSRRPHHPATASRARIRDCSDDCRHHAWHLLLPLHPLSAPLDGEHHANHRPRRYSSPPHCLGCVSATPRLRPLVVAKVPFAFTMHGERFPAGTYEVREVGSSGDLLSIQGATNGAMAYTFAQPSRGTDPVGDRPALVFNHYENGYRLSEIWQSGATGMTLPSARWVQSLACGSPHRTDIHCRRALRSEHAKCCSGFGVIA